MSVFPRPCSLFLFDLDGTLIDSRADIAFSLNRVFARLSLSRLPESRVAEFIGGGVHKLVERSLREISGREPEKDLVQECAILFREEYGAHLLDRTRLYDNVAAALDSLPWARFAVVSNKPEAFCRRILQGLEIESRFCTILGGDSAPRKKPDPDPLLMAMELCNVPASQTVMVGDSAIDIEAGRAAGVATCGVLGGFRSKEELEAAGPDLLISSLLELSACFREP